jgi:hypothetical protein
MSNVLPIADVLAAVEIGRQLAESAMLNTVKFYDSKSGSTDPVVTCPCRVKPPKPATFDASNSAESRNKRLVQIQIPLNAFPDIVPQGLIAQISGSNDPTTNNVNFTVDSQLDSTYAYARDIQLTTELRKTPRIS